MLQFIWFLIFLNVFLQLFEGTRDYQRRRRHCCCTTDPASYFVPAFFSERPESWWGLFHFLARWVFPKMVGKPPKWMVKIMEKPYEQMDDLGGTTIFGNTQMEVWCAWPFRGGPAGPVACENQMIRPASSQEGFHFFFVSNIFSRQAPSKQQISILFPKNTFWPSKKTLCNRSYPG